MADNRMELRASDRDRQEVVDRLRAGLEDGRLTMEEYVERMGQAYQALTYGDLDRLHADLPAAGSPRPRTPGAGPQAVTPAGGADGMFARLPAALKVLWTIWLTVVAINVAVWALVSATSAELAYPWPVWVAGPYGAVLAAISVCVMQCRTTVRASRR